ncbi:hypothetical protein DFS34DRAFT_636418 [Phlyctochytrium arcticum]|nr:hypothetical protein DFS34DRAFT_636418 [Phlyctochytrium arcticum]
MRSRIEKVKQAYSVAGDDAGTHQGSLDEYSIPAEMPDIGYYDSNSVKRAKAVQILRKLSYEDDHTDSLVTLGDIYLYGSYGHSRNASEAFRHFYALARKGNLLGQRTVGLMYATGVGVERSYAKGLLYLSFAAYAGDTVADQALGYWYWVGIGTAKSCDDAAFYYQRVAAKAVEKYRSGPPGGLTLPLAKVRLPDLDGGVYGHGASGAGDPNAANRGGGTNSALTTDDILQYYRLQADAGDPLAQLLIGRLFYLGSNSVRQNFRKAREYFQAAAAKHPGPDALRSVEVSDVTKSAVSAASQAMAYLGQMYWRGEGVEQNNKTARVWFERGAQDGNAVCLYSLGLMHVEGIAGLSDMDKGLDYIKQAAANHNGDAQAFLGEVHLKRGKTEYGQAFKWLQLAAEKNNIVALYHIGTMYSNGWGTPQPNCDIAVRYYKMVAEKADWENPIVQNAYSKYVAGDIEGAFLQYLFAAERGYEIAQTNAAWLLDQGTYIPDDSHLFTTPQDPYRLALNLWNRAANQGNVNARVKMGDYYYYGLGIDEGQKTSHHAASGSLDSSTSLESATTETSATTTHTAMTTAGLAHTNGPQGGASSSPSHGRTIWDSLFGHAHGDPERAAVYYQVAADKDFSSVAMWNLGWMHELGVGVEKDYHLAKRHYDMCLETNPEAYLPVNLALTKLRLKMFLQNVFSGKSNTWSNAPSGGASNDGSTPNPANRRKHGWTEGGTGDGPGSDGPNHIHDADPTDEIPGLTDKFRDQDHDEFWEFDTQRPGGPGDETSPAETRLLLLLCAAAAALMAWRQITQRRLAAAELQQAAERDRLLAEEALNAAAAAAAPASIPLRFQTPVDPAQSSSSTDPAESSGLRRRDGGSSGDVPE